MLSQLKNVSKLSNYVLTKNTLLRSSSTMTGYSNILGYSSSTSKHQDNRDQVMKNKQEDIENQQILGALDKQNDTKKYREENPELYDVDEDLVERKEIESGIFGLMSNQRSITADADETDLILNELLERDEKNRQEMIRRDPHLLNKRRVRQQIIEDDIFDDQEDGIDQYEREDREIEAKLSGIDPSKISREVDLSPGMPKIREKKRPFQEYNRYGLYNPNNIFAEGLIDLFRDPYAYIEAYAKRYNLTAEEYFGKLNQDHFDSLENINNSQAQQMYTIELMRQITQKLSQIEDTGFDTENINEITKVTNLTPQQVKLIKEYEALAAKYDKYGMDLEDMEFKDKELLDENSDSNLETADPDEDKYNSLKEDLGIENDEEDEVEFEEDGHFENIKEYEANFRIETEETLKKKLDKFFLKKEAEGKVYTPQQKESKLDYEIRKYNALVYEFFASAVSTARNEKLENQRKEAEAYVPKLITKDFVENLKREIHETGDFKPLSKDDEKLAFKDLKILLKGQTAPKSSLIEMKPQRFVDPAPILQYIKDLGGGHLAKRRLSKLIRFLLKCNDSPTFAHMLTSEEKELMAMRWPNRSASYDFYEDDEPIDYDEEVFQGLTRLEPDKHDIDENFQFIMDFQEMRAKTMPNVDILLENNEEELDNFDDMDEDYRDDDLGVERLYPEFEEDDFFNEEDDNMEPKPILHYGSKTVAKLRDQAKYVFLAHAERYFENIEDDLRKPQDEKKSSGLSLDPNENPLQGEESEHDPFKQLQDSYKDKESVEGDEFTPLDPSEYSRMNKKRLASRLYKQVKVLEISRHTKVTKAGRVNSFSCLIFAGDGKGTASLGYGKGESAPTALRRSIKDAVKKSFTLDLYNDNTLPTGLDLKYRSTKIRFYKTAQDNNFNVKTYKQSALLPILGLQGVGFRTYGRRGWKNIVETIQHELPKFTNPQEAARMMGKKFITEKKMYNNKSDEPKKSLQDLLSDKLQNQIHKDPYDLSLVSEFLYDLEKKPKRQSRQEIDHQMFSDAYDHYFGKEHESQSDDIQNISESNNKSRKRIDPMKTGTTDRKYQREQKFSHF
ncbi:hypothetical protein DLAC_08036 [Tieghemostelium lacteum]|uniref:S5 DRBM domain-containing protein n=1 Tax=Tieghemostelium lacteum TaxID=361077 RepID=A0A151ZB18_TIELA|nr:hypothetical protein DLAC_08036 [Tieghemostelium lacteum]|eukprot:KYQ91128.1 hypothetical protein DLAC_08036 [Tieghemostelium lacteum]